MTDYTSLSPDRPSTNPTEDLFGYAPFAKTLAKAINTYIGSDGIVLAIYGPWGSGKSTVLAYIQHELESVPEDKRLVVVPFNPWWFSGQEHLAKAFLGQLQAVLPAKHSGFKKIGNLLADFSSAISGVADIIGNSIGIPSTGAILEAGANQLASKPKDVPALKKALSDLLLEQKKRVLVVIDDIDRLTPDEVRQLFTVIKALGDFPYVTYLLAFDREVAATAISKQTGLPGERYLEKIIQVPFELPLPDRTALRQALFKRLEAVMARTPEGRFDKMHWDRIYHSGIDPLITVPRDMVRLTNVLSVTYPAVIGEVNPVDFIAIEALRIFVPSVYDAIRSNPGEFTGHARVSGIDAEAKQRTQAFHERWLNTISKSLQPPIKEMVARLFPRLESVWDGMQYHSQFMAEWRRQLRICTPEIFPIYFKLTVSLDAVSRANIDELLAATQSSESFAKILIEASGVKGSDGVSKVPALLDRFMDHVTIDVDAADANPIIQALFDVGDKLLSNADRDANMFALGNETRVERIAKNLLNNVNPTQRLELLVQALHKGQALRCSQYFISSLSHQAEKADQGWSDSILSIAEVLTLKSAWCERVKQISDDPAFIDHPSIAFLLNAWNEWKNTGEAVKWWKDAASSDEGLLKLISAEAFETRTQSGSDLTWRTHLRVDPRGLEKYGDIQEIAERVRKLLKQSAVTDSHLNAANKFLLACDRMKAGKTPDALHFFDDE